MLARALKGRYAMCATTATTTTTTTPAWISQRRRTKSTQKSAPLDGVRVLDLTRVLAGPYCTQLLGDYGADVIKIEKPGTGDDTRAWAPPSLSTEEHSESAYFLCVNRNKRSVAVDFTSQRGADVIRDLARCCDVVVENYLPGTLNKYGLDYQSLSKINPAMVYASITGYGQTGPYARRAGYDVIIEGEAGLMSITGEEGPDSQPVKVGVAITDITTGLFTHGAIMAALLHRSTTGKGQHIDANLINCQVAALANITSSFLITGKEPRRLGTSHGSIVPYQAFKSSDGGMFILGAGNDRQFALACEILGLPASTATDPSFATNSARVTNRARLIELIQGAIEQRPASHWCDAFATSGVPHGPVNGLRGTLEHPQIRHNGIVRSIEHPLLGEVPIVGNPLAFSGFEIAYERPPPLLGQHTREVLRDVLGKSAKDIDDLLSSKVVSCRDIVEKKTA